MPLLLFAAILLVAGLAFNLAYLDTGGEALPATPGSGSPTPGASGILDSEAATQIVFIALVAGCITLLVLFLFQRQKGIPVKRVLRPTTWMDMVAMLIAFAVLGLLLVLWPRLTTTHPPPAPGGGNASATGNVTVLPTVSGIPLGVFLAASLLASIVAIALFFRVGSTLRQRPPPAGPRAPRRAAVQAVQVAIDQLQLGADVRAAILACYARFCALLGTRGIGSQEALTARELEEFAVRHLAVSPASSDALTSLFEEARYSEHPLGEADRDRAMRSLERIRADLEG